jgi:hypothetical protein
MRSKRQHFVPQHYLRQFRIAGTKQVAVAIVEPFSMVGPGAINRQCQEDYFYGKDGLLDKLMQATETAAAPVLASVVQKNDFTDGDLDGLRMLAVILRIRTRKAAESTKVYEKRIAYEVIQHAIDTGQLPPPPDGQWNEDMIDFKGVPGLLMQTTIPCFMEMHTLAGKLLRASKGTPFITSDHPVVALNQFCVGADPLRSFVGYGRSGFQLVLPLSPLLSMFFYDSNVYKVGNRFDRVVDVSQRDTELLNSLQVQAAEKCLYFHDTSLEQQIRQLVVKYGGLRLPIKNLLKTYPMQDSKNELLHFRMDTARLPTPWSFCKRRKHVRSQPGDRRNPAWSELISALMKDIDERPHEADMEMRFKRLLGQRPRPHGRD